MRPVLLRPPAFWHDPRARVVPMLLSPFCWITAEITSRRLRRPGWRAPVPVICCGNAGVGGAGKTTVALDLLKRLRARGIDAHALTRGYGGTARGVLHVDARRHDAALVGDEALLLAAVGDTWVAADRAEAAGAAISRGAQCLVMDDGMQNPGLVQDCTLLIIDGEAGFGNQRLLPAGPLRESIDRAAARAHAAVLIGRDRTAALDRLPAGLPVLRATLAMTADVERCRGQRLIAFAGLARPDKFFAALSALKLEVVEQVAFADHHRYTGAELRRLTARAEARGARLVTTPKDAVRLPAESSARVIALGVELRWEQAGQFDTLLERVMSRSSVEQLHG